MSPASTQDTSQKTIEPKLAKPISLKLIKLILNQYNLKAKKVYPPQKGYRNIIIPLDLDSPLETNLARSKQNWHKISLVLLKNEPKIISRTRRAHQLTQFLVKKNFQVRQPLLPQPNSKQTLLKISDDNKTRYACLYTYLPGSTINWEAYTRRHLKLAGQVMSHLHQALANSSLEPTKFTDATGHLGRLLAHMKEYFQKNDVQSALTKKLKLKVNLNQFGRYQKIIKILNKLESHQVIHLDFVRSNLLFSRLEPSAIKQKNLEKFAFNFEAKNSNAQPRQKYLTMTGILDFEKSAYGPKIIDIARTLAFLLVDCKYKTEIKIRKYFLHSGYRKRGSSSLQHLNLLNPLVELFWLVDFYKFLLHNPYQFLPENEHFKRTQQFLKRTGLIETTI